VLFLGESILSLSNTMAAVAEGHAPAQGRGNGRIWNTTEEDVDVLDFTKAALAAQGLRLGVLTPKVKNILCAHSALGCKFAQRLVFDPISSTWTLQELDEDDERGGFHSNHPHDLEAESDEEGEVVMPAGIAPRGLNPKTKDWVKTIIGLGYNTTKAIEKQMIKAKKSDADGHLPPIPEIRKLHTFVRYYKKGTGALPEAVIIGAKPSPDSVKEYSAFMSLETQEQRFGRELLPDEFFVLGFEEDLSKPDDAKFRLVCTTKRLLELPVTSEGAISPYAQVYANDETNSFNNHGWPVVVTGCNDAIRRFRATAVSVCTGKSARDYEFVVFTVLKGQEQYSTVPPDPKVSLSDGADGIFKGVDAAVATYRDEPEHEVQVLNRAMCYMHVDIKNFLPVSNHPQMNVRSSLVNVVSKSKNICPYLLPFLLFRSWRRFRR
jgi:hypothetical protein